MAEYIFKDGKKMKIGYTTGTCAAAATKAAMTMLLGGGHIFCVEIITPSGKKFILEVNDIEAERDFAKCSVTKDGGDDPDATHGMKIFAEVRKRENGIFIDGGTGIGRVTKDGLKIEKGRAAINPVPLKMIEKSIREISEKFGYNGGIEVIISAPQGVEIGKNTFNPRLGIVGGISILGTTGVVEPMSERALIETIKTEVDFIKARGEKEILITVGNYAREFAKNKLGLDLDKGVKCSNFIGEAIDYAVYCGFEKILLTGHSGKLIKIAGGIMNTHSKVADCRMEIIGVHSAMAGMNKDGIKKIMECTTTDAAMEIVEKYGVKNKVLESIGKSIKEHLDYRVRGKAEIKVIVFGREDEVLIQV